MSPYRVAISDTAHSCIDTNVNRRSLARRCLERRIGSNREPEFHLTFVRSPGIIAEER